MSKPMAFTLQKWMLRRANTFRAWGRRAWSGASRKCGTGSSDGTRLWAGMWPSGTGTLGVRIRIVFATNYATGSCPIPCVMLWWPKVSQAVCRNASVCPKSRWPSLQSL